MTRVDNVFLLFCFLGFLGHVAASTGQENPFNAENVQNARQIDAWKKEKRPNIVILLVDDLGIGDIGCFGNTTINTPNIDQLARDGVLLQHNLAPESTCTPSRAAFLTGRYAVRSGMSSEEGDIRVFTQAAIQGGLPPREVTFAKELQQNGYKTGFFGKWHLGVSCDNATDFCHHPNNHGFDHFYGTPVTNQRECADDWGATFTNVDVNINIITSSIFVTIPLIYSLLKKRMLAVILIVFLVDIVLWYFYMPTVIKSFTRHRFACILMRDKKVVEQPLSFDNLTKRLVTDAVNFMQENTNQPFLLYMSFLKVHTALFTMDRFKNKSKHGRYGDNVEEMDWAVGKILEKIDEFHLRSSTFVYFTSDHGPDLIEVNRYGEVCGGFQGIFKGGKGTSFEGGIRVPTVIRWPGKIPPGSRIEIPTSGLDVFPTLLKIANVAPTLDRPLDGEDISGILTGQDQNSVNSRFIYHYCAKSLHAVTYTDITRSKIWKLHFVTPNMIPGTNECHAPHLCKCYGKYVTIHETPLVFELKSDPTESSPIAIKNKTMQNVIEETLVSVAKHKSSIKTVPNQLKLVTFLPWLQHCCNAPFCSCKEEFPWELIPEN